MDYDCDSTTRKSEIDQQLKKKSPNENQVGEILPNGFEVGLKNRSCVLSSDARPDSNEASTKSDGKVNGYISIPEASITNKTYASNEKNKHE